MKPSVVIVGAGALAAGAAFWHYTRKHRVHVDTRGWIWPLAALADRKPVISDGFGSPRTGIKGRTHLGVDVMYPRLAKGELADKYPPGSPNGSTWDFVPDETSALAVTAGLVIRAGLQSRGHAVTLKHTNGSATFYTHMEQLFVRAGDVVKTGQPIGIVGADPLDGEHLKHLHFELWPDGTEATAIDPAPFMKGWTVVPAMAQRVA
jgi:murein DD-endopeptidase MepM/ murein hydrolase activator NlpD